MRLIPRTARSIATISFDKKDDAFVFLKYNIFVRDFLLQTSSNGEFQYYPVNLHCFGHLRFCEAIGERFIETEDFIIPLPSWSSQYARDILKRRWPEAEPYIMKDPYWASFYAREVIKKPWPEAEPTILTSPYANRYCRSFDVAKELQIALQYVSK